MSQSWIRKLFGMPFISRKARRRGQNNKVENKARLSLENLEIRLNPSASISNVTPTPFSPNFDGQADTAGVTVQHTGATSETVGYKVYDSDNTLVFTKPTLGAAAANSYTRSFAWDGTDNTPGNSINDGDVVPDGTYTVYALAGGVQQGSGSMTVTVDNTAPTVSYHPRQRQPDERVVGKLHGHLQRVGQRRRCRRLQFDHQRRRWHACCDERYG